jgi:hypothetical protein
MQVSCGMASARAASVGAIEAVAGGLEAFSIWLGFRQ